MWNANADGCVISIAVNGGVIYAGGNFHLLGGQQRDLIAALDATTGLATSWNPSAGGSWVNTIAVDGAIAYVGGDFVGIGGQARRGLAALDISTGLATPWNPNANATPWIDAIVIGEGEVYVAGYFSSIGGQSRNGLVALDPVTGLATLWNPPWNPGGGSTVHALALAEGRVYAGGSFTSPRFHLAAIANSVTGIPEPEASPNITQLGPSLPNPSVGSSTIQFALARPTKATLQLFDITGRQVRTLAAGKHEAGPHVLRWDGKDAHGVDVGSGIYFWVLRTEETTRRLKLAVMR
jgi:hypothetical protein